MASALSWVLDPEGTAREVVSAFIIKKSEEIGCDPKNFRFYIKPVSLDAEAKRVDFKCFIYDTNKPNDQREIKISELLKQ